MTTVGRYPVLVVCILAGALISAADYVGTASLLSAGAGFAVAVAYGAVVTWLGSRSDTASMIAGRPVDERAEHIHLEASALALGISAVVILGAVAVGLATGGQWQPFAFMACVVALAYLGAVAVLGLRH
jgi:hypothetical protein